MRWVVVGLLGGCYTPAPPEGAPCGEGLRCPTGQQCNLADNRCYSDLPGTVDAPTAPEADAPPPSSSCVARRLLTGGMDVEAQGWTIERTGAATISYAGGMTTLTTLAGARQLIVLRDAFLPERWAVQVVGEITTSGGCKPNQASAALMASFHTPAGDANDTARMLCFSADKVVWGDGTGSIGVALNTTGVMKLERTGTASVKATIQSGSGQASMTANGFASNGTIAIGDQTTELGLDSTIKIVTVDLMCP